MKKSLLISACSALLLSGCYEPYVKDYDYSSVYVAYQYDLRSLVVGEGMKFKFGVVLGGVIDNEADRNVGFTVDGSLLSGSLDAFGGTTAIDGLKYSPSQTYVSSAINAAGISAVTEVPSNLYTLSATDNICIRKGMHTGTVTFSADSLALIADANMSHKPYYAFAWRITSADADTVLVPKSFGIVALRLENMFFGSWYHGGRSVVRNAAGQEISSAVYPTEVPSVEGSSQIYTLSTTGAYTCQTDYFHNSAGKMTITMDGENVSVSGSGITDLGCSWNRAPRLQNRKIYLNYKYSNAGGGYTEVQDTLTFRNRERDGVNEWQN